ncbi:MAG: KpsF/GutQ family sugar-phosphate isomerase [Alphaproteobacteria bacterium]|nr:KpsF/GutQ family sugar-phosphate isomerase [Alphaproteobacteria bacterium]
MTDTQDFDKNKERILAEAVRVLQAEGDALRVLSSSLNGSFTEAVSLLWSCKGRVIVTGMGKSGHVARKIAATLASTGTPSYFIHPGEASHGDLGMIVEGDVILALSNSGEVSELFDIIHYARRFSIPLIGMTSNGQSTLGASSNVALVLPRVGEACAVGLAPTTSTTMMMALGDALAVALMTLRGFTAENFRNFHPGGKLGKRLMRVADLMHTGDAIPLVAESDKMADVIVVMTRKSLGCAGVVDGAGALVGIITDGDLRRHMEADLMTRTAAEIMTKSPMTVSASMFAVELIKQINDTKRTQVFVVDENRKPLGVLHIHDLLRAGIA